MKENKTHEIDDHYVIICPNCSCVIKGTSEKHVKSNFKTHINSPKCNETARARRLIGGRASEGLPSLYGTEEDK